MVVGKTGRFTSPAGISAAVTPSATVKPVRAENFPWNQVQSSAVSSPAVTVRALTVAASLPLFVTASSRLAPLAEPPSSVMVILSAGASIMVSWRSVSVEASA